MATIECSVAYHQEKNQNLELFANGVCTGQYDNSSVFTTPPITKITFVKHITNYTTSYAAWKKGGSNQKGQFLLDKGILMGDLDSFAVVTNTAANGSDAIIILGGFVPTSGTDTAATEPATPVTSLKRGDATGVLLAESNVIKGAKNYGALISNKPLSAGTSIDNSGQLTIGANDFIMKMDLTKSRKKKFVNLTAGVNYYIYFYATNAAGVSQLSKVESIMCA